MRSAVSDAAIAVVRRNTEEVQSNGDFKLFEELFDDDFIDHTPQPGTTPTRTRPSPLPSSARSISRLPCRHPVAVRRRRTGHDLQDLQRHSEGGLSWRCPDRPASRIRNRRRHACRGRQNHRALGRRQPAEGDDSAGSHLALSRAVRDVRGDKPGIHRVPRLCPARRSQVSGVGNARRQDGRCDQRQHLPGAAVHRSPAPGKTPAAQTPKSRLSWPPTNRVVVGPFGRLFRPRCRSACNESISVCAACRVAPSRGGRPEDRKDAT